VENKWTDLFLSHHHKTKNRLTGKIPAKAAIQEYGANP